jgi:hypothetical protein
LPARVPYRVQEKPPLEGVDDYYRRKNHTLQNGKTYNAILRHADAAMYYIKSHGKNGVMLYDETADNSK